LRDGKNVLYVEHARQNVVCEDEEMDCQYVPENSENNALAALVVG